MARRLVLTDRTVDLESGAIEGATGATALTPRELDLLRHLAERPNHVVDKDELVAVVWGHTSEKTLSVALRRLRTKLEADPSRPRHLEMHRGTGVRLALSEDPGRDGVIVPATPLVAREAELEALRGTLASARLVTLVGPGGVGKTRLATELALEWRAHGAVRFFDLASARGLDEVVRAIGSALRVPLADADPVAQLGRALATRGPVLWVLDNAEQAVDAVGTCAEAWLRAAPEARFLVTSRVALGRAGERRVPLDPLDADGAIALLRQAAPSLASEEDVRELVGRTDGLPLALELAAPVAALLGTRALLDRWDEAAPMMRGPDGRHATIESAIGWSWDLLGEDDRRRAVVLATFRGPFDLRLAGLVLGADALPAVHRLCGTSLVQPVPDGFRMLELVRTFVLRHAEASVRADAQRRHTDAMAAELPRLAAEARAGSRAALDRTDGLLPDLLDAIDHAAGEERTDLALALVDDLLPAMARAARREAYAALLDRVLALPDGDEVLRAEALYRVASVHAADPARCLPAARAAHDVAVRRALPDLEGRSLVRLGDAALAAGDAEEAGRRYREAVALYERHGALPGRPMALFRHLIYALQHEQAGDALVGRYLELARTADPGDEILLRTVQVVRLAKLAPPAEAEAALLETVALCERLGSIDGIGRQHANVGSELAVRGFLRAARRHLERALANRRSLGLELEGGIVLLNLGSVHLQTGDAASAIRCLEESEAAFARTRDRRSHWLARLARADWLAMVGRTDHALALVDELARDPARARDDHGMGLLEEIRATVLGARGEPGASDALDAAAGRYATGHDRGHALRVDLLRVRVLRDAGELEAAAEVARRVVAGGDAFGHPKASRRGRCVLAQLRAMAGDRDGARALVDEAARRAEEPDAGAAFLERATRARIERTPLPTDPAEGDLLLPGGARGWSLEAWWELRALRS